MAITIQREKWDKVERFYYNEVTKNFIPLVLTQASIIQIQNFLINLQKQISSKEKDVVWLIQPRLLFDLRNQNFGIEPNLDDGRFEIL